MIQPEIWRKNKTEWAHVYPSGDVYYKDPYSTRNMHMFGSYSRAVEFLREMGYRKEEN